MLPHDSTSAVWKAVATGSRWQLFPASRSTVSAACTAAAAALPLADAPEVAGRVLLPALLAVRVLRHAVPVGRGQGAAAKEAARHGGQARRRARVKRDHGVQVTLDNALSDERGSSLDLIALDQALAELEALAPRQGRVVELRFFAGREDRLPVDANLLLALVAPRAVLMNYGLNDEVSNVWANEQSYHSARPVFAALGATSDLDVTLAGAGRSAPSGTCTMYMTS